MNKGNLLQLHHISVQYGGIKALDKVNISLREKEIVALIGPNGAGKSTILKTVFGLAPIYSGEVMLNGKKMKPAPHETVQLGISYVPQGRRVFCNLTVKENLEIGGLVIKDEKELKVRIAEVLESFPILKSKLNYKAGTLSGGQQQILALARGIMTKPKILLLDEPSLGLAPIVVKEVFAGVKKINEIYKTSIIVVEHNIKLLLAISHRAYVLDKGKVIAEGSSKNILTSDTLKKVFVGKPV